MLESDEVLSTLKVFRLHANGGQRTSVHFLLIISKQTTSPSGVQWINARRLGRRLRLVLCRQLKPDNKQQTSIIRTLLPDGEVLETQCCTMHEVLHYLRCSSMHHNQKVAGRKDTDERLMISIQSSSMVFFLLLLLVFLGPPHSPPPHPSADDDYSKLF